MLKLIANNELIDIKRIQFSDGAVSYDVNALPQDVQSVIISVDPSFKICGVLDELSQLINALRSHHCWYKIRNLYIPYLPYGRADRFFSEHGNFGLEAFIRNLPKCITEVMTVDPHNEDVFRNLLSEFNYQCKIMTQLEAFSSVMEREHIKPEQRWDYVIAPDKGAENKAKTIAEKYNIPLVLCTKERDVATGKLSNPYVPQRLDGAKVIIVDDLMDGGYTFIQLAQELYKSGANSIDLYATHMIASRGLEILRPNISNIFCFHTVAGYVTMESVNKFNKLI